MKTIEIAFTTREYDTLDELINVATLEDIEKIYKIAEALKGKTKDLTSFAVNVVLFDIPENSEFKYNVAYVTCYIGLNGEINAYQYFQNKYDARDQMESDYIDLEKLKKYLSEKAN